MPQNWSGQTDFGERTIFSLQAQLIAVLIHYPFTVPLPRLANWSAFL